MIPTQPRKKLTVARRTFRGLMTKHQRVQMRPVAVRAAFCVNDSLSAGRAKSEIPAMTIAHFITGALCHANNLAVNIDALIADRRRRSGRDVLTRSAPSSNQ